MLHPQGSSPGSLGIVGFFKQTEIFLGLSRFVGWAGMKPVVAAWTLAAFVYVAFLLILRFFLLPRFPLVILRWNENLAGIDWEMPASLGKVKLPCRRVLLIGFYQYHYRVLEAWVSSHIPQARRKLSLLPALKDRGTFVGLPVRVNGETRMGIRSEDCHNTCAAKRWRILIKGEGGLGKTTLALRMAQWAMADTPIERLCRDRQMVPIILDPKIGFDVRKDVTIFKSTLRAHLQELITAGAPISEELFEALLVDRRILVVLDGLSEMPASVTQPNAAIVQNPDFPAMALLITSREEELGGGADLVIEPQRIDTNHLLPFMNAYLAAAGQGGLTDAELFDASRRLAELVTMDTGITPLLGRLFAEQLSTLHKHKEPISNLPRSVPDLMLSYLNYLNRNRSDSEPGNADIHRAAKIAAWACLRGSYKPGQRGEKEVIRQALVSAQLSETLLDILEMRLGVVKTVEPAESHVQFLLDPLSEYLAALAIVEQLQDERGWRSFMKDADEKPGSPASIRGFLSAVYDCCLYKRSTRVPEWVADELIRRTGGDPEIINASRRRRRKEELMKSLDAIEGSDRVYAATELGKLGSSAADAVPTLIRLLKEDRDSQVRAAALRALGSIQPLDRDVVLAVARALSDQARVVAQSAYEVLGGMGPRIFPMLQAMLGEEDDESVRRVVAWALRHLMALRR